MRVLSKEEARVVLSKMVKYQGDEIIPFFKNLSIENLVFRLQKNRIYFCKYQLVLKAENFIKNKLASVGICIGRFCKKGDFFIFIPGEIILQNIVQKKIIKLTLKGEKFFTYGSNITKEMIYEIPDNLKKGDGVCIEGLSGIKLGLAELLKSTLFIKISSQKDLSILNHADIGAYIRVI